MSLEPVPTAGGPDVLPNPIPEPDPEPPKADPTPEPSPVPPVPEPVPAFFRNFFLSLMSAGAVGCLGESPTKMPHDLTESGAFLMLGGQRSFSQACRTRELVLWVHRLLFIRREYQLRSAASFQCAHGLCRRNPKPSRRFRLAFLHLWLVRLADRLLRRLQLRLAEHRLCRVCANLLRREARRWLGSPGWTRCHTCP